MLVVLRLGCDGAGDVAGTQSQPAVNAAISTEMITFRISLRVIILNF